MRYVLASLFCTCLLLAGCQMPAAAPAATSAPAEEAGATAEVTDLPEAEADATEEMAGTPTAAASEEITGTPTAGSTEEITSTEESTTDPIEVVTAFYAATGAKEYDKAITFVADDAVFIGLNGTYTGKEAILAHVIGEGEAGIVVEVSSPRNVDGIVVYHFIVTQDGNLLVEADNGITVVEDGKITFDGNIFTLSLTADPTAPIEVVKAFYVALNAKLYYRAKTFVADDATLTDDAGSYQGVDQIAARIEEVGDEGRSYDIWDLREVDGTVSYNVRVYQDDTVLYETTGSDVVEDGEITMSSTAEQ